MDSHDLAPDNIENTLFSLEQLPGASSQIDLLLRHSEFDKNKFPQIVGPDDMVEGAAEPHESITKLEGFYGPEDESAISKSLTIPGLSTEEGRNYTRKVGAEFAERLLSDGVETYVIIAASPSRWPNEEMIERNVPHEFGNRCIDTAIAFSQGLQEATGDNPNIRIGNIFTDERLREVGYQYNPDALSDYAALSGLAKKIAKDEGFDGNPNMYFINNHPDIAAAAALFKTRNAVQVAEDIAEFYKEQYAKYEQERTHGVRVVVVGVTHAQDMRSFVMHEAKDEQTAVQNIGYGNSQSLVFEHVPSENGATFSLLGVSK